MNVLTVLMLVGIAQSEPAGGQSAPSATAPAVSRPAGSRPASTQPSVVQFQKGIRIDWARRQVEVDGVVVLRQGLIELFACSRGTREYESIVRVDARPLHVYQAMGLIGLVPGHPIRLNAETEQVEPATGDPVEVEVRYTIDGKPRQEPVERWLRRSGRGGEGTSSADQESVTLGWVFAGSVQSGGGSIEADEEGTVVALVDFSTSIVALAERHSDHNDELWLEPATSRIPVEGTRCTLMLRRGPVRLGVDATGRMRLSGRPAVMAEVAQAVRRDEGDELRVQLRIDPRCSTEQEREVVQFLRDLRVPSKAIEILRPTMSSPVNNDAKAMTGALRGWLQRPPDGAGGGSRPEDSTHRFAEDLRQRAADLERRTQEVSAYVMHLGEEVRRLVFLPADRAGAPRPPQ